MPFAQVMIYSIILLAVAVVFFFFRNVYQNRIRKIIFPKKLLEEEREEDRIFDELYQKNKHKELMKHQEMMRGKQKDIQVYREDPEIVGITKPVGKWTKIVMLSGRFMQRLVQLGSREGNKKGFCELFIEAQASTQGRHKGKGR